jgi:hypothetical protein
VNKGTCKHFTGVHHNTHCGAGVCYRDVTTDPDEMSGSALRIACHSMPMKRATPSQLEHFKRRGKCDKYEEPSDADVKAWEDETTRLMDRFLLTLPLCEEIKETHKGKDWTGVVKCPACGGSLHVSHAGLNGHVWGRCEVDGCVSWME